MTKSVQTHLRMSTVWFVNDGLSGNLWKPAAEVIGRFSAGFQPISSRVPSSFWCMLIEKPYFQVQSPSAVRNRLRRETYWTKSYDNISKYPFSTQFMVDAQSRTYQKLHIMPAIQNMSRVRSKPLFWFRSDTKTET